MRLLVSSGWVAALAAFALFLSRTPPIDSVDGITWDQTRVEADLKVIAAEPHITGSIENAKVRAHILQSFRDTGLDVERQTGTITKESLVGGPSQEFEIHNIIARLPSTVDPLGAPIVVFAAHYDSRAGAPGAGDDGAACAALLEIARQMTVVEHRTNTLVFLITDGEEARFLGAQLFVQAPHPLLKQVKLLFNFEGRGNSGPGWMFETSPDNHALVRKFYEVSPRPYSWSLMSAVYRILPNDTDFSVFRAASIPGLNFAWIGGYQHYHRATDTAENLSRDSLYHHYTNMFSLARAFVDIDPDTLKSTSDATFFTYGPWIRIIYSNVWVWPITLFAWVIFGAVLRLHFRRKSLALQQLLRSLLDLFLLFCTTTFVAGLVTAAGLTFDRNSGGFPWGYSNHDPLYFFLMSAAAAGFVLWRVPGAIRQFGVVPYLMATWMVFGAGATLLSLKVPDAAFIFNLPFLGLTAGSLATTLNWRGGRGLSLIMAACTLLILAPLVHLFHEGLMLGLAAAATPLVVLGVLPLAIILAAKDER